MIETQQNDHGTLMKGTEEKFDYLIVAVSNHNFTLGIKPLVSIGGGASFFGIRVRAVPGVAGVETITGGIDAQDIMKAFPNIQFMKANDERASMFLGAQCPFGGDSVNQIGHWLQEKQIGPQILKLVDEIVKDLEPVESDFKAYFTEVVVNALKEAEAELKKKIEESKDKVVTLAFPTPVEEDDEDEDY